MTRKSRASFILWMAAAALVFIGLVLFPPGRHLAQFVINPLVTKFNLDPLLALGAVLALATLMLRLVARRMFGG